MCVKKFYVPIRHRNIHFHGKTRRDQSVAANFAIILFDLFRKVWTFASSPRRPIETASRVWKVKNSNPIGKRVRVAGPRAYLFALTWLVRKRSEGSAFAAALLWHRRPRRWVEPVRLMGPGPRNRSLDDWTRVRRWGPTERSGVDRVGVGH